MPRKRGRNYWSDSEKVLDNKLKEAATEGDEPLQCI